MQNYESAYTAAAYYYSYCYVIVGNKSNAKK